MTAGIEERSKAMFAKRMVSLRRYGHAIEVAHATVSFVLPTNSFMNGSIIPVDGGVMAQCHVPTTLDVGRKEFETSGKVIEKDGDEYKNTTMGKKL